MHQWVDVTTTYHDFVSSLDINMQSLLDNGQVNKRANGGGSLTWADVVAICWDQLSGVALVPTGTISGVSTVIETGIPGIVEVPNTNQGGLVVVSRYLNLLAKCYPLASKVLYAWRVVGRLYPIYQYPWWPPFTTMMV